jgi:predicted DNA-binding WGR domain protein
MAIIRKEKFIFVESVANHNKFWYIEEHDSGLIKTIWGRVGNKESVSEKQFGSNVSKEYDKLVKSKLKKGYTRLNTIENDIAKLSTTGLSKQSLESLALSEIDFDKSNKTISNMIKLFCAENIHNITENTSITFNSDSNIFQTPCGIVTVGAITEARNVLDQLFDKFEQNKYNDSEFTVLTEKYCTIIPQKIKGRFEARKIFNYKTDFTCQYDILNSLEDSLKIIEELKIKDVKKKANTDKLFNVSLSEVTAASVIKRITNLFNKTRQSIHSCRNLKVKRVFELHIAGMERNYQETVDTWNKKDKPLNHQELWHGTKKSNIISIDELEREINASPDNNYDTSISPLGDWLDEKKN